MAWGYWTAYNTCATRHTDRQGDYNLNPPSKRDRSLEREIRERDRFAHAESGLRTPGSYGFGSSGGSATCSSVHRPFLTNPFETDKVAFERRLLLGDPDWSSRTVADRNTLPKKRDHNYDGVIATESDYLKNVRSPETTPTEPVSRKSDMFCPACAHHPGTQHPDNRDSRVSFGSLASSSRGSKGSSSARGGSVPTRSRSYGDDDEGSYCEGGGVGGKESRAGNLSTSKPPFSSRQDILEQHTALMETINQKIAILSSFKAKQIPSSATGGQNIQNKARQSHPCKGHHRRSASNVKDEFVVPSLELDHSSSSHQDGPEGQRFRSEVAAKSSSRSSSRKSSKSRTPGSAGSRRSRESLGRNAATSSNRANISERFIGGDGGDDGSDGDSSNLNKTGSHRSRSLSSSSPLAKESLNKESIEKAIARQVVTLAMAAAAASKANKLAEQPRKTSADGVLALEEHGTVKRRTGCKPKDDQDLSTLSQSSARVQVLVSGRQRGSQNQTPNEGHLERISKRHISTGTTSKGNSTKPMPAHIPLHETLPPEKSTFTLSLMRRNPKVATGIGNLARVSPLFKHYEHNSLSRASTSSTRKQDAGFTNPPEWSVELHRPRSASIDDTLTDTKNNFSHKRDTSLTPRKDQRGTRGGHHFKSVASVSSKSEKSSRSSHSPSIENNHQDYNSPKCCRSKGNTPR